jgi:hypothetical protein
MQDNVPHAPHAVSGATHQSSDPPTPLLLYDTKTNNLKRSDKAVVVENSNK